MNMNGQGFVVYFLFIICLCLFSLVITCLASPLWGCNVATNFSTGLNWYCNGSECYPYAKDEKVGYLFATGFFVWTSVIISFFGCGLNSFFTYLTIKQGEFSQLKNISTLLALVNGSLGLSMLIAMSCFTVGYAGFRFEYPYYLGWGVFASSTILSLALLTLRLCWNISSRQKNSWDSNEPRKNFQKLDCFRRSSSET